jgi:hypothetical protein
VKRDAESPPEGLRGAGRDLWSAIHADLHEDFEFDARELHLLERACRCADELADLEQAVDADGVLVTGSRGQTAVHPALSEARQLRLVQLRLLGGIHLPDADEVPRTVTGLRAQRAARSRWGQEGVLCGAS